MGGICGRCDGNADTIWFPEFERSIPSLAGKRIAITGTTTGTGRVVAESCLKHGAELFMVNRDSERAQKVLAELKKAYPAGAIHHVSCDMLDFASVREGAKQLMAACQGRLDVLCNNAGCRGSPHWVTNDQCCGQMQSNHFSHFLLTKEIFPALKAAAEQSGEARVVNHTSMSARMSSPWQGLYYVKQGPTDGAIHEPDEYNQSKLAQVYFTYALADKIKEAKLNIKACVCHPGIAMTGIWEKGQERNRCLSTCYVGLLSCNFQSGQDGAMPLLACVAAKDVQNGDFIVPTLGTCVPESKGPVKTLRRPLVKRYDAMQNKELMGECWKATEAITESEFKI